MGPDFAIPLKNLSEWLNNYSLDAIKQLRKVDGTQFTTWQRNMEILLTQQIVKDAYFIFVVLNSNSKIDEIILVLNEREC